MRYEIVDEPFEVEIKDGLAILTWPDGTRRASPLRVFRIQMVRSRKALEKHDRETAKVIPIGAKKRKE